ncbi:hypothetical protein AB0B89_34235, partial [Sphaerisporangium sp. NPDC049002]|uniref:hypothetical protein n=1 Tax=Sphaerisporangium sp. NPDC049002 TaxID=3155392 RepID=UPI0033FEB6A2
WRLDGTSRMNREVHVRICGGGQVRFLPATRQWAWGVSHSERRAWMVKHFDEIQFDYSVLEDRDLDWS